jgi:S-adenosylmethionine/arginine decarboxylase-like enzyme
LRDEHWIIHRFPENSYAQVPVQSWCGAL